MSKGPGFIFCENVFWLLTYTSTTDGSAAEPEIIGFGV
jgi:hypothetical protein